MVLRKKVLVLDPLSEKMEHLSRHYLKDDVEIIFCKDEKMREEHIASSNVLVTFTRGIPQSWISKAKQCIFIQKLGAGVNNIDIEEAACRNIPVANTIGLNATSVAEHAVMLMTATLKHLVVAHNNIVYQGKWLKTDLRDFSYELSYKKVGLIGFGNIGKQVRRLLKGYECEMFYYDPFRLTAEKEMEYDIEFMELDQLIQECEIISLHVPLNNYTHHLMNENRLKKMKENAVLINTCRGGVIDEEALYRVMKSGHLTGAGLDVFETEPLSKDNKLLELPNIIVTPHIGGGTNEAMGAVIKSAFENVNNVLENGKVANMNSVVNLKLLKEPLT